MVDFSTDPSKFRSEFELVSAEFFLWRWKVCESWCIDYSTIFLAEKDLSSSSIPEQSLWNLPYFDFNLLLYLHSTNFFNKNACFENTAHLIEQSSVFNVERIFQLGVSVFSTNQFSERTFFFFFLTEMPYYKTWQVSEPEIPRKGNCDKDSSIMYFSK